MDELFERYQNLIQTRLHHFGRFQAFSEDSIRYDFYYALIQQFGLLPHNIILEQPMPDGTFIQREQNNERGRGRHQDKPEFDLRVDAGNNRDYGILAEFAFFRTPEIAANQDKTGKLGKILNEVFRLSLLKHYQNIDNNVRYQNFNEYRCLLICVTDFDMINYGAPGVQGPQVNPIADIYTIDNEFIESLRETARNKIQDKFRRKAFEELEIIPTANRIYNINTPAHGDFPEWAIWAWEIDYVHVIQ